MIAAAADPRDDKPKGEIKDVALSPSTNAVNRQLEAFRVAGAHILQAGAIQRDIPLHEVVVSAYKIELVKDGNFWVSPDKEVYASKGEFSLTRVSYDRFAQKACIQWMWRECQRIEPFNNPRYCAYRAVGKMMDLSGRWRVQTADKAIDMDIVEQELRDNYRGKAEDYMLGCEPKDRDFQKSFPEAWQRANWVEEKVRIDALQIQKHILARAQTGAMNRVTQKLLGLKASYSRNELAQPFVFAALTFRPDPTHPVDRQYMLEQGSGMGEMLYRQPSAQLETPEPEDARVIQAQGFPLTGLDEEAEIVPPSPAASTSPSPAASTPPPVAKASNVPSAEESQRADFASLDAEEQKRNLEVMIKLKAYKGTITGDMAKWKVEQRLKFYEMLAAMPTVGKGPAKAADDLPFERS